MTLARGRSTRRLPLSLAATVLSIASPAWAVEHESRVGAELGVSMLVVGDKSSPDVGPLVGAHWTYGLSDAFNLMVEGSWSLLALNEATPGAPADRPAWGANADVGIGYVFDVLTWVPYMGLMGGGYALGGGTIDGTRLLVGFAFALGVDYRFSRWLTAGFSARQHMLSDAGSYPSFTQLFAEAECAW